MHTQLESFLRGLILPVQDDLTLMSNECGELKSVLSEPLKFESCLHASEPINTSSTSLSRSQPINIMLTAYHMPEFLCLSPERFPGRA
jgi:hypothetical protein